MFTGPPMTKRQVAEAIGMSESWIDYQRNTKRFPRPSVNAKRNAKWLLDEVRAYLREGQPDIEAWERAHWGRSNGPQHAAQRGATVAGDGVVPGSTGPSRPAKP